MISVVIPTYNRLPLLKQAVESVVAQIRTDWEIIVVDDGSTDGTSDFFADMHDERIRTISVPHSGNVARVRNIGAQMASGQFLAFLDSDDLWLPQKLQIQLDGMIEDGMRWSYTRYEHVDEQGKIVPFRAGVWKPLSGRIARQVITAEASPALSTILVERELFNGVGRFDEDPDFVLREDHDLIVRLALASETIAIPECLAYIRHHPGRSTEQWSGATPFVRSVHVYDKLLRILNDQTLRQAARRRRSYHLAEAGARYLRAGARKEASRCFFRSLLDRPSLRHWLSALARGFGPEKQSPN